jgi:uncharacterized RDD family membrane protein YckC
MKFIKILLKMEKIKVQTSQNVAIEYSLANAGERLIANLFDYLVIGAYYLIFFLVVQLLDLPVGRGFWAIISLLPMLYQLLSEIFLQGQSFGMRIRKIKVIRLDGKELTIGNCVLRWILRPIDILICGGGIAVVSISITDKGQRLGDIAAGTTVVKMKTDLGLKEVILDLNDSSYIPVYPQVASLSDADMEVIKESILVLEKTKNIRTAFTTSKKLESILNVKSVTPYDPIKFLKTLVKDYNHLTGIVV